MSLPIGLHPAGTAGLCHDSMLLPPASDGRRLRCQLEAGHAGMHIASDPDNPRVRRSWPPVSHDPHLRIARAAAGANVTPITRGPQ